MEPEQFTKRDELCKHSVQRQHKLVRRKATCTAMPLGIIELQHCTHIPTNLHLMAETQMLQAMRRNQMVKQRVEVRESCCDYSSTHAAVAPQHVQTATLHRPSGMLQPCTQCPEYPGQHPVVWQYNASIVTPVQRMRHIG
jgi:hypothetical protein